ncbi:serine-rich adhesin for platelets-like isoform X2 [Haliotis cracherodii]|uniref:serine-rich adhesin for platelets-like isoform X2 n=1 Tax=Haliotis cracherodii TaxID=6455 RepID=UPI0039ED13A1
MSIVLPAKPSPETNTPDGQLRFSGRDDLDHACEPPEPQGEGQRLINQNRSLGDTEVTVGRSHFANVDETNSRNTGLVDETSGNTGLIDVTNSLQTGLVDETNSGDAGFVDETNSGNTGLIVDETDSGRVDETTDRARDDEQIARLDGGNVDTPERVSSGEASNAQSCTDDDVNLHPAQDQHVTQVEPGGQVGGVYEGKTITEHGNTEPQNTESQILERQNTESQNTGSQNTESQILERQNTGSQSTERQITEHLDTESQITERQDTESQNTERQNTESLKTERQITENQITDSQITDGISMDLSRRQTIRNSRALRGNNGLGSTRQNFPRQDREQDHGTGGPSTSMQRRGTDSRVGSWETGTHTISSLSLPKTSLEVDQGDLESSVVSRLERTGMVGFRQELVQTRRRSTDDTSEKNEGGGRYRHSVDITATHRSLFLKQGMEKSVHDVDQTNLKFTEAETQEESSDQRQPPASTDRNDVSPGSSSPSGDSGVSYMSCKQPARYQSVPDPTGASFEKATTTRQNITKVDEVRELEDTQSLEDSGISESGSWSIEARTDTESLQDLSSPEETSSGDITMVKSMLTSSERGTPDGSVQERQTTELSVQGGSYTDLHAQGRCKGRENKTEADLDSPINVAHYDLRELGVTTAIGELGSSSQEDLSRVSGHDRPFVDQSASREGLNTKSRVSGDDSHFADQSASREALNTNGRTQTDTRSLLKKQSVTDTISLTNEAMERFGTSQAAITPTSDENMASSHKVTSLGNKSQEHHKSGQTNTESAERHELPDKTRKESQRQPQQDRSKYTPRDSRREEYPSDKKSVRVDTVSGVTEKSWSVQGTETRSDFVKQEEHATSSKATGYGSKGSGAQIPKASNRGSSFDANSADSTRDPRKTSLWALFLPACKVIVHLMTRAEHPFYV